jgi:hypothetical protein
VQIGNAAVEFPASEGRSYLRSGEPMRIRIPYRTAGAHDDVVFAFHHTDGNGDLLYGTNSDIVEGSPHEVDGPGEYVFDLEHVPLHTGTFFLDIGIHTMGGLEYDHRPRAVEFQVSNGGSEMRSVGRVMIPTAGHHHPAGSPQSSSSRAAAS